jgi:shikimate dehydrogenase
MIFAEVIGDPIAQTKSPVIHKAWLAELGLEGDYRATRVAPDELGRFLAQRRTDPDWRGCNVTIPHKEKVLPLLDHVDPGAEAIGAVNCVVPGENGLTGRNTDIDGMAAALAELDLHGRKVALIGAGGGARAAIRYLLDAGAVIDILVRDPNKAAQFASGQVRILPLHQAETAFQDAAAIVNASPMGMAGAADMPPDLLASIAAHAQGKTLFDMVYKPLETPFLATGRANGATCVDGLVMLIGQARAAFRLFFGHDAPADDESLRRLLTA